VSLKIGVYYVSLTSSRADEKQNLKPPDITLKIERQLGCEEDPVISSFETIKQHKNNTFLVQISKD